MYIESQPIKKIPNFYIISNSYILQGNAATKLRRDGYFYMALIQNLILNATVKEFLKSIEK